MFDVVYKSLTDDKHIPTVKELTSAYELALAEKNISFDKTEYLNHVEKFYLTILKDADTSNINSLLKHLAAIEVGDRSEKLARLRQNAFSNFKTQYQQFVLKNNGTCQAPPALPPTPVRSPTLTIPNPIAWGANKTMSIAYQSCNAIEANPMNNQTPDVQGIIKTGPNGAGFFRKITDLLGLIKTNYYLQDQSPKAAICVDVKKSPLIYDYGGKPFASPSAREFDLFKNYGSGGEVLGIDCSGFVYTAVAAAGLRISPGIPIKPILVTGVNANMYREPEQNGLGCFAKIAVGTSGTIKSGDLIAQDGHIVIIDAIGSDPLAITNAKTAAECEAITSQKFDFIIIQSSASKNGIGINKYIAKDFLQLDTTMKSGLEAYAREACKAKLAGNDTVISGLSAQVVRHSQSQDCSETQVSLVAESCTDHCPTLQ
jgi:hypothetical protein